MGRVPLGVSDFEFNPYLQTGDEAVVAEAQVPRNEIWQIPKSNPSVGIGLVGVETQEIAANATDETVALTTKAAKSPWYANPVDDSEFTTGAFIVVWDADNDKLITDDNTDDIWVTGFTQSGDFVSEVTISESAGNATNVEVWYVASHGKASLRRVDSDGRKFDEPLSDDVTSFALSNPYDEENSMSKNLVRRGGNKDVFAPKYKLQIAYYGETDGVELAGEGYTGVPENLNLKLNIPIEQKTLTARDNPKQLRREVDKSF